MNLQKRVNDAIDLVLQGRGIQEIPVAGYGPKATSTIRVYVSRRSLNGDLATRFNRDKNAVLIGTRIAFRKVEAEKFTSVKIPDDLYRFTRGLEISESSLNEIRNFLDFLTGELKKRNFQEEIIPEFDSEKPDLI